MNINSLTTDDLAALAAWDAGNAARHDRNDADAIPGGTKIGSLIKLLLDLGATGNLPYGIRCINKTGGTIAKSKPVSIVGWDSATDCWKIDVTAANTGWAIGVLDAAVVDGAQVSVKSNYTLTGVDTSGWGAAGDPVYVNAGVLSKDAPGVAKNNQIVGYVATKAASGSIRLLPQGFNAPAVYIAAV